MELSPSWEANSFLATNGNSQHFIEPKHSLLCSQKPATAPYPQPDESSPHSHMPFTVLTMDYKSKNKLMSIF
jgi:hypothetical protein